MAKGNFHKAGSIKRVSQKSLHSILERPPAEYILAGFLDKENGFWGILLNQAKVIFPLANQSLLLRRDYATFALNSSEKCKFKHKTELFYEWQLTWFPASVLQNDKTKATPIEPIPYQGRFA